MSLKLLPPVLSLCLAAFVQLTSSQPADDVTQPDSNVNSCGLSENFERTVLTALTQLQKKLAKLRKCIVSRCLAKAVLYSVWKISFQPITRHYG